MRSPLVLLVAAVTAWGGLALPSGTATADSPAGQLVSEVAAAGTPHVLDGRVYSVNQVGNTVFLAGTFTRARNDSGDTTTLVRNGLLAFDATTGKISTTFVPNPNGVVRTVLPAGDGTTVYVGGGFTTIAGVTKQRIARLRISDGGVVAAFNAGAVTGEVKDLALSNGRLWVGGAFSHVGGRAQTALTTINPTTGAPLTYMSLPIAGSHNGGVTQVLQMDVTPDGSRLVAVGNFDTLAGVQNHQLLTLDLTGATSAAPGPWRTGFYLAPCASAFDSYMRDVDYSPDGSYLVVGTTGAYGGSSGPCDTVARFETDSTGTDVAPSWVDYSGGDTTYSVEATDSAVYVGGHQRWWNNPFAGDRAGPGAISREGIAALDPINGVPFSWNPGRVKGVGVFDFLLTDQGLWVASDTDRIGAFQYKGRIARLPRNGVSYPAVSTPTLPDDVYVGGPVGSGSDPSVLYRVNAGGPSLPASSGPDWDADTDATPSAYHGSGSNRAGYGSVPNVDATVPSGTPRGIFDSELWDPNGDPRQEWDFPVASGTPIEVRLYFANRCTCTAGAGQRIFDVDLDGALVLDDLDLAASPGHDVGTMRSFDVTSDGNVDIDLAHVVENPLLNGIEIVRTDVAPPAAGGLTRRPLSAAGVAGSSSTAPTGGLDWNTVRGAFMVNGGLYLAHDDGTFDRRTFTGTSYGAPTVVDTSDEIVRLDQWHSDVASSTGMFLDQGRLYYTLAGSSQLFYRYFTPQSGIVGAARHVAASSAPDGVDFASVRGMFATATALYWATADGALHRIGWDRQAVAGAPVAGTEQVISGPGVDGASWGAHALFLFQDPTGNGVGQPPTASFTSSCTNLSCSFDAGASTAPGGVVDSYAWQFGDGTTGTGANPQHVYSSPGTVTVTLTVSSSTGGVATTTRSVTTTSPPATGTIAFVGAAAAAANATQHRVTVPPAVRAGDTLVLYLSLNTTAATPTTPAGWTALGSTTGDQVQGRSWTRTATAADAGSVATVTTSALAKSDLTVEAYRASAGETSAVVGHAAAVDGVSGTSHTSPTVTVGSPAWVTTHYVAKSSADVGWATPAGTTLRTTSAGTGGGRMTSIGVDTGAARPPGTSGGTTATSSVAVSRTVMFTTAIGLG